MPGEAGGGARPGSGLPARLRRNTRGARRSPRRALRPAARPLTLRRAESSAGSDRRGTPRGRHLPIPSSAGAAWLRGRQSCGGAGGLPALPAIKWLVKEMQVSGLSGGGGCAGPRGERAPRTGPVDARL